MKKAFIIVGIIVVGLVVITKLVTTSKAPAQTKKSTQQSLSVPVIPGWKTYTSSKYGYSIQHPEGWTVDESRFESKQELLFTSPTKDATLRINAFFDKAVNSPEAITASVREFEKKMRAEPGMTVTQFKDMQQGKTGGFIATGEQVIHGESYVFENRGLLGTSGKILIFHGIVKKTLTKQYGDTISRMIESFRLE